MNKENKHFALLTSSLRAGGGEKMMIEIARELVNLGHRVDLVVMKNTGQLITQIDSRINLVDLKVGRMFFAWIKLKKYLRDQKPDAIMSVDEYTHLASLWAKRGAGYEVKVILRVGNMYSELFRRYRTWKDKLIPFFIRRYYKQADKIIAVSRGVADDIINVAKLSKDQVVVIHNPKAIKTILDRTKISIGHVWMERKNTPLLVAVGRLREQKNFDLLIKAFNQVVKQVDCRLMIIGVGREEEKLRNLTRELKCEDKISFPGYTDNPYRFMALADIFVSTSLWEGMPNGVIEALICGAPMVVADCDSGPREILAPDTDYKFRLKSGFEPVKSGFLVAINDEASLVEVLLRMLNDEQMRQKCSSSSLERSQDFSFDKIIRIYESVLMGN